MSAPRRVRRPNGAAPLPVRSIRISDDVWEPARRRANYEGVTMSHVVQAIMEGYGKGMIDMPRVTLTYSKPKGS